MRKKLKWMLVAHGENAQAYVFKNTEFSPVFTTKKAALQFKEDNPDENNSCPVKVIIKEDKT